MSDIFGMAALSEINKLPAKYLGNVATRCRILNSKLGSGGSPVMIRHTHFARDYIVNPQIVIPNWYGASETVGGETATVTASIEYPEGTFTQATFSGATSGTIASGANGITDPIPVTIPCGAKFWSRIYIEKAGGTLLWTNTPGAMTGDGFEFGPGKTDKTMGGSVTQATSSGAPPIAILAYTRKPSIGLIGDSRVYSGNYMAVDGVLGNRGELELTIGKVFPYINLAVGGETGGNFITYHTKRLALLAYCSHVICDYGINDIVAAVDAATTATRLATIAGYFTDKPFYLCTLPPVSTSTDTWATTANQTTHATNAERVTLNNNIRANGIAGVTSYFDMADAVESGRDSGLWFPGYTGDGTHENAAGAYAIVGKKVINPALFSRG